MNKVQQKRMVRLLVATWLLVGALQSAKADTVENFQLYLRDSLVATEQFNRVLKLAGQYRNDTLFVQYNHCAKSRSACTLVLTDSAGQALWQHTFAYEAQRSTATGRNLVGLPLNGMHRLLQGRPGPAVLVYIDDHTGREGMKLVRLRLPANDPVFASVTPGSKGKWVGLGFWLKLICMIGLAIVLVLGGRKWLN